MATRVSVLPLECSETLDEAWSVPPLMARIRAMRAGIWMSWMILLRREVAVAFLV